MPPKDRQDRLSRTGCGGPIQNLCRQGEATLKARQRRAARLVRSQSNARISLQAPSIFVPSSRQQQFRSCCYRLSSSFLSLTRERTALRVAAHKTYRAGLSSSSCARRPTDGNRSNALRRVSRASARCFRRLPRHQQLVGNVIHQCLKFGVSAERA